MGIFEVTVVKWVDDDGIEKREIGKMLIQETGEGTFKFSANEGSHPLVPVPLRYRGRIEGYHPRQSVWALVGAAISTAVRCALLH